MVKPSRESTSVALAGSLFLYSMLFHEGVYIQVLHNSGGIAGKNEADFHFQKRMKSCSHISA